MKNTTIAIFAIAIVAAALSGCSHPAHSIAWYEHHPKTMNAVNAKCGDEPSQGINNQNCLNAQQAVVNHLMSGIPDHGAPPKPFNLYARNPCPNRSC